MTRALWPITCIAGLITTSTIAVADPDPSGRLFSPTPSLTKLADQSWTLVDHGGVTSSVQMMAYSGGWYDTDNHQFCIFGGGHFNYSGNEVWCFDITSLEWNEMYPPDVLTTPPYEGGDPGAYLNFDNKKYPGALFKTSNSSIEDARPMSRHTYDALEYIDGHGAALWGGIAWGDIDSPWCTRCEDTWFFTYEDRRWHYLYGGKNPSPNKSPGVGASAYSASDRTLYSKVLNETWSFDPSRLVWTEVRTRGRPPWSIEGTLEYDPVHRSLYFFGGNYEKNLSLWRYDIEARTWRDLEPKGAGPVADASNGPGLAYDAKNDVLLVYFAGSIWAYHPQRNTWEKPASEQGPTDNSFVFGRFRYDPINNGFWLHTMHQEKHATWFYRYRN